MKLLITMAVFLCALSCVLGAPPTREEVFSAIAQMESNIVSVESLKASRVVVDFAKESPDVQIAMTRDTIPWLKEKWAVEPEMGKTIRSMLLAAYIAGNVKSQLAAGKPIDDPYAGWVLLLRAYAQFREKAMFSSPSIDALKKKQDEGTLKQFAEATVKKGERDGATNRNQLITNSTASKRE